LPLLCFLLLLIKKKLTVEELPTGLQN